MTYDTTRARRMVHRQIGRLGGRVGAIRREGFADLIPIFCAVIDYSARESSDLIEPTDRKCIVSTFKPDGSDLHTLPDKETDTIVIYTTTVNMQGTTTVEVELNIVTPPKLYDPNGVVCAFELQVRK